MIGAKPITVAESVVIDDVLPLVGRYRVAIDGGAHVGTQTVKLAAAFERVIAFEPSPENFAALRRNTARLPNVDARNIALMDTDGPVTSFAPDKRQSTTARQVVPNAAGTGTGVTLDSLSLVDCDFIKLDVEGCEWHAINGARSTIERCSPFLLVEMGKLGRRFGLAYSAVSDLLDSLRYVEVFRRGVDVGFRRRSAR